MDDPEETIQMVIDGLEIARNNSLILKMNSDAPVDARRWAIVHTDLEKVWAYIQTYLVEKE